MSKENPQIIPEEFLEELVQNINDQFGWPDSEDKLDPLDNHSNE